MSVFAVCVVCIEETYLVFYLESGPITTEMVLVCPQMYYFILYKKLNTIYFAEDLSMKERRRKPLHTI